MNGLPIVLILLTLSIAVGSATAEERGDGSDADPDEGYYARADAHPPRLANGYSAADDCTVNDADYADESAIAYTTSQIQPAAFDPTHPNVAWAVPTCVAFSPQSSYCPLGAPCPGPPVAIPLYGHASYNVTSGDFAVLVWTPFPSLAGAPPPSFTGMGVSGNSGLGLMFDCQGCPPPGLG